MGISTSNMFERIANNDLSAVSECLDSYGDWVWSVAKKYSDSPVAAEQLTILIFRDIWKYAHRFKTSGLGEQVFIALLARRRVKPQPVTPKKNFDSNNKFFTSFRRYANGGRQLGENK